MTGSTTEDLPLSDNVLNNSSCSALILERQQNGVAACSWYVTLTPCNNFPKFQLDLLRSYVSEFQLQTTSANVSGYMCKVQPTLRKWLLVMKCLKKPNSYSSYYACVYMCLTIRCNNKGLDPVPRVYFPVPFLL